MKVLCVLGEHAYGNPARGENYEHANFLPALRALGCEVVLLDSLRRDRQCSFAELNRALIETVRRENPDLVLCVLLSYEIWTETLAWLRDNTTVALMNWGSDDSWKYRQFTRHLAPYFDLHATTHAGAAAQASRDGLHAVTLTQWAADEATLATPLPAARCRYPVSFVGAAYGNRRRWIEGLRSRGVPVHCFGHGWEGGTLSAKAMGEVIRESVLCLNFGDSGLHFRGLLPFRSRQIKARVFEVPGRGGFLLTEPAQGLANFLTPGQDIALFQTPEDLARQATYYLAHPEERDRMARAGHDRVRSQHTYRLRFSSLLETALAQAARRPRARGEPLWNSAITEACDRHRATWASSLLRALLCAPAQTLLGPRRGPRAARRALYEISWRLAGARTYSAAGLPGRLFYRES